MSANQSSSLYHRLRRLKAALLAVSFTLAGILLMMLNAWLAPLQLGDWQWLHALPLGELGGTLFGAGLLSTFFEYTVTPRHRFRKFAVVSDRQRYDQLVAEHGETSVWYRRPVPGLAVSDPEVFALEQFTVNGTPVPFTRQVEEAGQIYVVDLGTEVITTDKPVVIAFRFRSLVPRNGHVFHLNIDRPTKGLDVELSYDADAIERVRLMDFASRGDGGRVSEEPQSAVVRYRYDGWLFPRAGLVFAWTLHNEQVAQLDQAADAQPQANASQRTSAGQRTGIAKSSVSAGNDDARPAQAA